MQNISYPKITNTYAADRKAGVTVAGWCKAPPLNVVKVHHQPVFFIETPSPSDCQLRLKSLPMSVICLWHKLFPNWYQPGHLELQGQFHYHMHYSYLLCYSRMKQIDSSFNLEIASICIIKSRDTATSGIYDASA